MGFVSICIYEPVFRLGFVGLCAVCNDAVPLDTWMGKEKGFSQKDMVNYCNEKKINFFSASY